MNNLIPIIVSSIIMGFGIGFTVTYILFYNKLQNYILDNHKKEYDEIINIFNKDVKEVHEEGENPEYKIVQLFNIIKLYSKFLSLSENQLSIVENCIIKNQNSHNETIHDLFEMFSFFISKYVEKNKTPEEIFEMIKNENKYLDYLFEEFYHYSSKKTMSFRS